MKSIIIQNTNLRSLNGIIGYNYLFVILNLEDPPNLNVDITDFSKFI